LKLAGTFRVFGCRVPTVSAKKTKIIISAKGYIYPCDNFDGLYHNRVIRVAKVPRW
jgi:hypothetical protein